MSHNLTAGLKLAYHKTSTLSCPGLYCGQTLLANGNLSECGACPRGYRPDLAKICLPCNATMPLYQWMYLAFMMMLPLVVNGAVIDLVFRNYRKRAYILLQLSALFECACAALVTVLIFRARDGSVSIKSCGVERLTDWYTLFFNPKPDYIHSIRCTQEIVYPLYSMVFAYVLFSLLFLLLFRGLLSRCSWSNLSRNALLASLYQYPVLLVMHACLAGIVYYVFPYASIILSVISSTVHYAMTPDQTVWKLCRKLFGHPHSLVILFLHWLFLVFGILSLFQFQSVTSYAAFLSCIPIPTLIYVGTIRFTDPTKFYDHFD